MIQTFRLRTFVPAKDFELELRFYKQLGFTVTYNDGDLAVMNIGLQSFYLQKYYVKEWAENFMLFLEVSDVDGWYAEMRALHLEEQFEGIRFAEPKEEDWGRVCRIVTPSGVLWHFGKFHPPSDER